jgi:hypothetical protein
MPNDATRATAEAMPKINRRKALALVGLGAVSTAAIPAQGMAMTTTPSDLATIEDLIATLAKAYAENSKLWEIAGALDTEPPCKVQVSRLYCGRDDEGNEQFNPVYAYSAEQIASCYDRHMNALLSINSHGPNGEAAARKIRENIAARIKEKQKELTALNAAKESREIASGYRSAMDAVNASTDVVQSIEAQILGFVPQSMEVASRLARWAAETYRTDRHCLFDPEDLLTTALNSIGKAGQS